MDLSTLSARLTALQQQLTALLPLAELDHKEHTLQQLQAHMQEEGFWTDPQRAVTMSQQAAQAEKSLTQWRQLTQDITSMAELVAATDLTEEDTAMLESEYQRLASLLHTAETTLLLSGKYDEMGAIITLSVGNGGEDAEDFTQMLERMLLRYSESQGWHTALLESSPTPAGLRSSTLSITGPYAYGMLRALHGVHRLIRLSPFNAKSLRQTSFARVEVTPDLPEDTDLQLQDSDLRVDVFRSSGPGGQSVNTTDSAVRITYLPLGLTVTCQNEKSQHQNKAAALHILKGKLLQLQAEQNAEHLSQLRGEMLENSFGSQILTYTLQPYQLVKDHRNGHEESAVQAVLDGHLQPILDAALHSERAPLH